MNQTVRIALLEQQNQQLQAENQALQQAVKATGAPPVAEGGVAPTAVAADGNVVPFAPRP